MYRIADWSTRKTEIAVAFHMAAPLLAERDDTAYGSILDQMDVTTMQDFAILYAVVEDAIMATRREGRPAVPLEAFKEWLQVVRRG